jgi:signal transduction histidine kinase
MSSPKEPGGDLVVGDSLAPEEEIARLRNELGTLRNERERAVCMAAIQSEAVQLALDLAVTHPDLRGFFRMFIKRLVDDSESHACGVWLMDEATGTSKLFLANVDGETIEPGSADWRSHEVPRESMSRHLSECGEAPVHEILEYDGDDERLPEPVREFHRAAGVRSFLAAPLWLPPRKLGWITLASVPDSPCERQWRHALLDATAKQATLAVYYTRLIENGRLEARRQAVLEERNRIAGDIHDTLAQGFGAILMQLQAAQRGTGSNLPAAAAGSLETAVHLARTHLIEARRSVAALRPSATPPDASLGTGGQPDVHSALSRIVDLAQRTCDVPVELVVDDLPTFTPGVEPEIIGIAQEALTNAVRHSRGTKIVMSAKGVRGVGFRLSVADDGRGIAGDRASAGFGMTIMRERAERIGATLTFVTAARSGTEVVLAWQPASFSIPRATDGQH